MQLQSQPAQQTAETSSLARPSTFPDTFQSDKTFPQVAMADMLDDSYWEDLPDLAENSSSDLPLANLFSTELNDLPLTSLCQPHNGGLSANLLSSSQLSDPVFSEDSCSWADMDIASLLADTSDFSLAMLPEKELQPGTPSGQMKHVIDTLLQPCLPRSHTPVSRDTSSLFIAGQDSLAMETCGNTAMMPTEPGQALPGPACSHGQHVQQTETHGVHDSAQKLHRKHPKIIVRLKRPLTKKSKATKPKHVPSSRSSVRLACKNSQPGKAASRAPSSPAALAPPDAQLTPQTNTSQTTARRVSHSTGSQTDLPGPSGASADLHVQGKHPTPSATPAEAPAEGTKLLLSASRAASQAASQAASHGIMTRHQRAQMTCSESSAAITAAPWTLLTQANMRLKLKPQVATTATQTEDPVQSLAAPASNENPQDGSVDSSHQAKTSEITAANSITSDRDVHRCSQSQSEHRKVAHHGPAVAQQAASASKAPNNQTDSQTAVASRPAAGPAAETAATSVVNAGDDQALQQRQVAIAVNVAGRPSGMSLPARAATSRPQALPTRAASSRSQAEPARAVDSSLLGPSAGSPRPNTRSSSMKGGKASYKASARAVHRGSDTIKPRLTSPRRAVAMQPLHSLSPNAKFMFQQQPTAVQSGRVNSKHSLALQAGHISHKVPHSNSQLPSAKSAHLSAKSDHLPAQSDQPPTHPSAESDHLPAPSDQPPAQSGYPAKPNQHIRQSGYPRSESEDSAAEYSSPTLPHSACKDTAAKHHKPTCSAVAMPASSDGYLPQSGYHIQSWTDPLEIQLPNAAPEPASVSAGCHDGSQAPTNQLEVQLPDDTAPSSAKPGSNSPLHLMTQDTGTVSASPAVVEKADGSKPHGIMLTNSMAVVSANAEAGITAVLEAGQSPDTPGTSSSNDTSISPAATISRTVKFGRQPEPPQSNALGSIKLAGSNSHEVDMPSDLSDDTPQLQSEHVAPYQALQVGPSSTGQAARALLPHSQQTKSGPTANHKPSPDSVATTRARAAVGANSHKGASVQDEPHSSTTPSGEATHCGMSGGKTDWQADLPDTQDALRSDIMAAAGCRVTRRLVQQIMKPASDPGTSTHSSFQKVAAKRAPQSAPASKPVNATGQSAAARDSTAAPLKSVPRAPAPASVRKPPSKTLGQSSIGKAKKKSSNSKQLGAAAHRTSMGRPLVAVGTPPSTLKGPAGKGSRKSAAADNQTVSARTSSNPGSNGSSAQQVTVAAKAQPQHSNPAPPAKADKAKINKKRKVSATAAADATAIPASPTTSAAYKQTKTRSASELKQTTSPVAEATTTVPPAKASPSVSGKAASAAAPAGAVQPSKTARKAPADAIKPVNDSIAPRPDINSNSSRHAVPGADKLASGSGSAAASEAVDSQAVASAAGQSRGRVKRQMSDESARSDSPKKAKRACATAAGLNPKFLSTKDEVLKLIGDRQGVLEGELRHRMGNNPDTSKALRKLHREGSLQRSGAGGRPDPFKWTKVSATDAVASTNTE